jgi:tetratricopeptide (TPR) repeat protein
LVVDGRSNRVILCANCCHQFLCGGQWPPVRTSGKAVASLVLGIASLGGICFTGIPAFLLGLWAYSEIRAARGPAILTGKWIALAGAALGGFFGLSIFVLPLVVAIPISRFVQREAQIARLEAQVVAHAREDAWREAIAASAERIELDPEDPLTWLKAAPLYVRAGDEQGYHAFSTRLLQRFASTTTPDVADKSAKACALLPPSEANLATIAKLARVAVRDPNDWAIVYSYVTLGLVEYRSRNYGQAIEACRSSLAADPEREIPLRTADAFTIQAMAYHQLGQDEAARNALREAEQIIAANPLVFGTSWQDELISRILLEEARRLWSADEVEAALGSGPSFNPQPEEVAAATVSPSQQTSTATSGGEDQRSSSALHSDRFCTGLTDGPSVLPWLPPNRIARR